MNFRQIVLVLNVLFCFAIALGKTVSVEIPQACKDVQWNVNSAESESSFLVSSAVYQSLVRLGPDGVILSNLASAWQQTSPTQIKFTLKDDVFFSNGVEIESQDVKLSLEQILSKTAFTKIILSSIKSVEIIDKKRFYLNLFKNDPLILQKISIFFRLYYLRNLAVSSLDDVVPGTGPWRLDSKKTNRYVFKSTSREKHEELIIFCNSMGNTVDRVSQNAKGDLVLIEGLSYKDQLVLRRKYKLNTVEISDAVQIFGVFNMLSDNSAIKDLGVRKAINIAIDRSAFGRLVLKEQGHMLPGLSLTNEVGHNDLDIYPYNVSASKNIIDEWKKSHKQSKVLLRVGLQSDEDTTLSFVEQLKYSLKRVGVELIVNKKYAVEKQRDFKNEIDLIFGSDPSPYFHIDFLVRNFYVSSSMFYVGSSTDLDKLIESADTSVDVKKSEGYYKQIDKYLYDNYWGIPGFQPQKIRAYSGNVQEISSQGPLLDFSVITGGSR